MTELKWGRNSLLLWLQHGRIAQAACSCCDCARGSAHTAISGRVLPQYSLQDLTAGFYCHCLQETTFLEFVPPQPDNRSLAIYAVFCVRYNVNQPIAYGVKHQPSLLLPQLTSLQGYEVSMSTAKAKTQVPGWSVARHCIFSVLSHRVTICHTKQKHAEVIWIDHPVKMKVQE